MFTTILFVLFALGNAFAQNTTQIDEENSKNAAIVKNTTLSDNAREEFLQPFVHPVRCREGNLGTNAEVKNSLTGKCANPVAFIRNKSAHNCPYKYYQCNGICDKISRFSTQESGVCVNARR